MRNHFTADWAFGVRGAIEAAVRREFPAQVRTWPLLQSFAFEAYSVSESHFVLVLRDRLSGVPSGPGKLHPFPDRDHPPLPVSSQNLTAWLDYLIKSFALRGEDLAMILPIHDSGKNSAAADFELFSEEERALWEFQLRFAILRQKSGIQATIHLQPSAPAHNTYNVTGPNPRIVINSVDNSVNVVNETPPVFLDDLLRAIRGTDADSNAIADLTKAVEEMKAAIGTKSLGDRYLSFMSALANHIQVFGPVVAPYLPALAKLISP